MKRKTFRTISLLLTILILVASLTLLTSCSTKKLSIEDFCADETFFVCGVDSTATFSAKITGNAKNVYLYSEKDDKVAEMTDDGKNGDKVANDGIYSRTIDIKNNKATELKYYAKLSNIKSKIVTIYLFSKPTKESKKGVVDFQKETEKLEKKYTNEDGYVDFAKIPEVVDSVKEYAAKLYADGELISYEATNSSVIIKWKNGLTSVYSPKIKNTYIIKNKDEINISAYQPYYDWVTTLTDNYIDLPNDVANEALLPATAASEISNLLEKKSVAVHRDSDVSLASIKTFKKNQIIIWQGHGVYAGSDLHSLICTGKSFDWDAWFWNVDYFIDCCQNRIVDSGGSETFSYKYLDKYCPNIDNSVVLLGPCQSGYDSILANSFLNKGATAVIANTDTILCLYGDMMQYTTMHLLTQVNSKTNNYYTLSESLAEAKELYGKNDKKYGGAGAEPIIFGGEKAEKYRLGDYVPQTVEDFSIPNDIVVTLGEVNVIEPIIIPADANAYSIKWSSSDESVATISPTGEAGIITALKKGTTTITAELTSGGKTIKKTTSVRVASKARDTVLVLDVSGSMDGTPMEEMKKSAIQFCKDLLKDEYNNKVGIVFYDDSITKIDLSNDLNMLISRIEAIRDGGRTDMEAGLSAADSIIKSSGRSDAIKNVIIMADGLPNEGKTSYSGSMPSGSYLGYFTSVSYANAVIDTAKQMMNNYNLYSLGFFHSLSGSEKDFGVTLMKQLTNMADGYHQVDKAEDLQFAFGDISEDINVGSKIVINIACPVDVKVSYGGETLSNASDSYCDATSFGSLQLLGKNKDIKVVSLDNDKKYEVELVGTGVGKMDYSVNYFDEKEQLSDYRSFETVPITTTTVIESNTDNSGDDVALNIDEDGDGEVDVIWTALAKGKGKITYEKNPPEPEEPEKEEPPAEKKEDMPVWAIILICVIAFVFVGGGIVAVVVSTKKNVSESDADSKLETPEHIPMNIVKCSRCGKSHPSDQPCECLNEQNKDRITEEAERSTGFIQVTNGSMNGFSVPIKDGETLYLGKDPKVSNLVFTSDYKNVSRMHCAVTLDAKANRYFVTDSSSNGTYLISKKRLIKGKRTPVDINTVLILANDECTVLLG